MKLRDFTEPLYEAPIGDYATIGNWGDKDARNSFRHDQDRKIVTAPKAINKVRRKFGNTEHMMNFYFVNLPGAAKQAETGMMTPEDIQKRMPKAWELIQQREQQEGTDPSEAINVLFVGNAGVNRKPMTAWIMAHRLGHAIQATGRFNLGRKDRHDPTFYWKEAEKEVEGNVTKIFQEVYGKRVGRTNWGRSEIWNDTSVAKFFEAIGTMRSAREGNLGGRPYEFMYELFAQYVTTGEIKFNPIPRSFGMARGPRYRIQGDVEEDTQFADGYLNGGLSYMLPDYFDTVLYQMTGKYLVM